MEEKHCKMPKKMVIFIHLVIFSTGLNRLGPGTHQAPLFSSDFNNTWKYTCSGLHGLHTDNYSSTSEARVKDKAVPLQAWTGPEGSRSLRLPDFKTIGT